MRDVTTNKDVEGFGGKWVWAVGYSPDGRFLASQESRGNRRSELVVRDATTGKEVRKFSDLACWAFGPGERLAVIHEGKADKITVHGTTTWKLIQTIEAGKGPRTRVLLYSPDGKWLVSWSGDRGGKQAITVRAADDGKVHFQLAQQGGGAGLAISSDSRYLAAGWGERTVQLWKLSDGSRGAGVPGRGGPGQRHRLQPRRTTALRGGAGRSVARLGSERRQRVPSGRLRGRIVEPGAGLPPSRGGVGCAASPARLRCPRRSGRSVPLPQPNKVTVYEALTGKKVTELTPHVGASPTSSSAPRRIAS